MVQLYRRYRSWVDNCKLRSAARARAAGFRDRVGDVHVAFGTRWSKRDTARRVDRSQVPTGRLHIRASARKTHTRHGTDTHTHTYTARESHTLSVTPPLEATTRITRDSDTGTWHAQSHTLGHTPPCAASHSLTAPRRVRRRALSLPATRDHGQGGVANERTHPTRRRLAVRGYSCAARGEARRLARRLHAA